jgi:regulator of protease activity HflC (stomatin/prohibitin superfamily)
LSPGVGIALVAVSVRRVRVNERLGLVRFGRIDASRPRGPGIVLLVPVIDRGVRISLAPQHFEVDGVSATTSDGRGIKVDIDIRLCVVDPVAFTIQVPTPAPLGVRILARGALTRVVEPMILRDALDRTELEAALVPLIEEQFASARTVDVQVHVTRVLEATVNEADERATLVRLGAGWLRPDPDISGPRTFASDVAGLSAESGEWPVGRS